MTTKMSATKRPAALASPTRRRDSHGGGGAGAVQIAPPRPGGRFADSGGSLSNSFRSARATAPAVW